MKAKCSICCKSRKGGMQKFTLDIDNEIHYAIVCVHCLEELVTDKLYPVFKG